jgi:RNA polymerase sigma-70 factor, ECF subfamily
MTIAFLRAAGEGNLEALVAILAADVVAWMDGGGKRPGTALHPITGADHVARFVAGVLARGARDPDTGRPEFTEVNGQFGLLWRDRAGTPTDVVVVEVADGVATAVFAIRNPDKLARFA